MNRKSYPLAHVSLLHFQLLLETFILPCAEEISCLYERTLKMPS